MYVYHLKTNFKVDQALSNRLNSTFLIVWGEYKRASNVIQKKIILIFFRTTHLNLGLKIILLYQAKQKSRTKYVDVEILFVDEI